MTTFQCHVAHYRSGFVKRRMSNCSLATRPKIQQFPTRAPRALRAAARAGWARRWWGQVGCALQRALASKLLGGVWHAPAQPACDEHVPIGRVLALAEAEQPSRLPLRA